MAQALYREWFVHFRFPGHERVKMVPSPLGPIPEGWRSQTLEDVAINFDRMRKPLSSMQRADRKGPYPYFGAARIFDYIDDYIFDGDYLLVAEDGSVITTDRKPVLQMAHGKFWANNHTHILQGEPPVSTEFLYLRLTELDISGYITGAAQPKVTQENLNRIPVLLPSSGLLKSFCPIVRDMFLRIRNLERKTALLRRTRDLLLPKLISGEIDVSNLDTRT
jgi:type I restriction enzyme S subunit